MEFVSCYPCGYKLNMSMESSPYADLLPLFKGSSFLQYFRVGWRFLIYSIAVVISAGFIPVPTSQLQDAAKFMGLGCTRCHESHLPVFFFLWLLVVSQGFTDAPCMDYLPTLGETWPHSKGNVVNIPYNYMEHLGLCLFNDARLLGCKLQ